MSTKKRCINEKNTILPQKKTNRKTKRIKEEHSPENQQNHGKIFHSQNFCSTVTLTLAMTMTNDLKIRQKNHKRHTSSMRASTSSFSWMMVDLSASQSRRNFDKLIMENFTAVPSKGSFIVRIKKTRKTVSWLVKAAS